MKFLSTALLLLGSGLSVEAVKNSHGFDSGFLKAMNQGAASSEFLRKVTTHERKQFWKNLLKKAKPATEANLRAARRKLDQNNNDDGNNYQNYNGQNANGNNQNYNNGNYNNQNYANGNYNNQNYANADYNQDDNMNNGGYWNYGNNDINYNYNGGNNVDDDQAAAYQGVDWSNLGFDMKSYSLKYTGCSAVKTYDSNKAASDEYDTVLSTKRFALFRLCPTDNCNKYSVSGCGRNYGQYVLEMDAFLEGVVEFNRQRYWHYCKFCTRCNALESYGETMSALDQQQMYYYEQMQEQAQAYYEAQQAQYQAENQYYANENAANYQYYNNGQQNQNQNQNGQNGNNGGRKLANNNQYNYRKYYNNQNGQNNQNQQDDAAQDDQQDYYNNQQKQGQNMYNNYYWNDDLYGEWNEDWSPAWLAFNWQVLPYCTTSELNTCSNADNMCSDYTDDFEQNADAMGGFSACTQIDDNYYIGPHCNSDGYTITLGVYSDEYCDNYVGDEVSLYDVLGYDIGDDFDFFPQECVSCEESGDEIEFANFMASNQDFDNYEEWLDSRWEQYVEMSEQNYQENYGDAQNQWQAQQSAYYNNQNYGNAQQQGYYYQNGQKYQNGGGSYYYGDQSQQYAQYGGQGYKNMAEQYGNYGASMLNQGMNFYYNRGMAGSWMTTDRYNKDEYQQQQQEEDPDYYNYKMSSASFASSGIADVCGALYTYAAKCNKNIKMKNKSSSNSQISYGSWNQENNEDQVCNFIDNLQTQKYNEYGDIVTDGSTGSKYSVDFASMDWTNPDQVKAQAQKAGVSPGQAVGLALTMAACLVMSVWACCLHSTLARKNIPWRPKRGKNLSEPTDISRQHSGIVMGRSRSNMSAKNIPLIS